MGVPDPPGPQPKDTIMKKHLAVLGLTAGLAGGAITWLAFTGPAALAGARATITSTAVDSPADTTGAMGKSADRPDLSAHLQTALKGLVTDGTITQAQAEAVVTAIEAAGPPEGGRGGHRGSACKLLPSRSG